MDFRLLGKLTFLMPVPLKQACPSVVNPSGRVTVTKPWHPKKACSPITFRSLGRLALSTLSNPLKALSAIFPSTCSNAVPHLQPQAARL